MAKRKNSYKRSRSAAAKKAVATRRRNQRQQEVEREPLLDPETARLVGGIFFTLVGVVLLLSLFRLGGPVGTAVAHWGGQALGLTAFLFAILMIYYGVNLIRKREPSPRVMVGGIVIIIGLAGLLHLFVKTDQLQTAMDGQFGGLLGHGLTATTSYAVGSLISFLIFIAMTAVGVLVMFGQPRKNQERGQAFPEGLSPSPKEEERVAAPVTPTEPPRPDQAKAKAQEPDFQPRTVDTAWEQPPLSLLNDQTSEADAGDTKQLGQIIEQTLANFNLEAKVENVNVGPTVTQYELRPAPGVKVTDITQRSNDLALALAAHPIRIDAPIPGKSSVGIEVPNRKAATVRLHQLFSTDRWKKGGALPLALGLDVSGNATITDLASMPHLLIAGQTGSGKSVAINGILMSLLYTHSPKHLRLLLIDPKRVELANYNGIPHLLAPVIVDPPKVINALKWVVSEMERRYKLFQDDGARNIIEYNRSHKKDELPYLVIVVDELADLMQVAGKAVEGTITRIAQLARATGIHLIIATQRPSVNVITGVIKANFPSRVAFNVSSAVDSRTILDKSGAEKLLGAGDMLFQASNAPQAIRVQGAYVEAREIKQLTDFLKGKGTPVYDESVTEQPERGQGGGAATDGDVDPMYDEAKDTVVQLKKASTSLLQRRLGIGYARAARIMDQLEDNGIIGPGQGAKPRDILVDSDEV
ncbi:DNA translocase FtsK [Patescibacteria group bacterium]|nr:DNA translocase FtsK [Patescibacteria group bacterium]